jgi:hypothetical protein
MNMASHQNPSQNPRSRILDQRIDPGYECLPILIIPENINPFNPPDHHMMERPWRIESRCPWHDILLPQFPLNVK